MARKLFCDACGKELTSRFWIVGTDMHGTEGYDDTHHELCWQCGDEPVRAIREILKAIPTAARAPEE